MPEVAVSGFVVNRQYVKIDAPEDSAFAGFWAEVRQNLTNGERRVLIETLEEIASRETEDLGRVSADIDAVRAEAETVRTGTPAEQREVGKRGAEALDRFERVRDQYQRESWALIAPHVRAWNAVLMDGDDVTPIEPPATAGVAAFEQITLDMAEWLAPLVLTAYRLGKDVRTLWKKPGGSPPPTGGPKLASSKGRKGSSTPRHPTNSSTPSASMLQA